MKIKYTPLILMATLATTFSANATEETNKTIEKLGVQGNNIYFMVAEGIQTTCKWGYIYADHTNSFGKTAYSTLLMAKASGKRLSRFVYTQTANGEQCTLTLVEVNQ
jgi:hypothetical protein